MISDPLDPNAPTAAEQLVPIGVTSASGQPVRHDRSSVTMHGTGDDEAVIRLAAIMDASDDAIYTVSHDGIVTSWNAAAEKLFGFGATEIVGHSVLVLFPKNSLDDEQHIATRTKRGEQIRELDVFRMHREGSRVRVALTVVPLRTPTGQVVGTLRIARDASGSQSADRVSGRLAAIVESSDDAIIGKDLNGIVTSWNEGAERIFGYTASEMIGESIRILIPADREAEEDHVLGSIRSGHKVEHFDTVRRHKNGSLIPISLTVSPIRDSDGRIVGASKIARDISERRAAEGERTRLLAIAEQNAVITRRLNDVGVVVASDLDRARIVQAVADAATDLTNAECGAFFYSVIHERGEAYATGGVTPQTPGMFSMPRHTSLTNPVFRGSGVLRSVDISQDPRYREDAPLYRVPAGRPIRSYLAVPVEARSGEVLGGLFLAHSAVAFFDDRHEQLAIGVASWASVALENARLYMELHQTSRLKDEFLATLSHELRTPLNAILGYARMIHGGVVPVDRLAKAVATIERNATSLNQIVEDVLDVSRIISGKLRLNVQPVEVQEVVRNAIGAIAPLAEAKGLRLESLIDPQAPPISGDAERLQQVIWNVLSNAVKFSLEGEVIQVRVERIDTHIEITVSDRGVGIPPEFLPHVFERFRQADSSITRERGGLGLGLGIARQLVELHGGTIEAISDGPGLGSTFRVRLPLMSAATEQKEPAPVAAADRTGILSEMPNLSGVRVLVVDDDRDALQMVREILEAAGAHVSVADSALSALETVGVVHPDVLVADLGMPRMDGFELISQIRRSGDLSIRSLPAAALTAYARSEDCAKALRCGFQMHLAKPIDPVQLMDAVAGLAKPRVGS